MEIANVNSFMAHTMIIILLLARNSTSLYKMQHITISSHIVSQ